MGRRTGVVSCVAFAVLAAASCGTPVTREERAAAEAAVGARRVAATVHDRVDHEWRERGGGDAARALEVLVPYVEQMQPDSVWVVGSEEHEGAALIDLAVHEKHTLGGGFGGADATVRLCARLEIRVGSPVVMTNVGCPADLGDSTGGLGTVDTTVVLED